MLFRTLIFSMLLVGSFNVVAQVKPRGELEALYRKQDASVLFANIDEARRIKREGLKAGINSLDDGVKAEIIKNADRVLMSPWPLLTFTQFNEYKINGNRVNYENNYFARRNKLNTLVIAEMVANNGKYIPEIINGLGLILEESSWALPAHMTLQKAGDGLPDVEEPVIDLFAAQTAMILSYTRYLLGKELNQYSPAVVKRIDFELKKRIFDPYVSRDDFWWMGFKTNRKMNNWNIFINTNILTATIFGQDDAKVRNAIIEKSIESVDHFLAVYTPDGGCDEGPAYWGMAGGALIEYLDLLSVFSGKKLDFSESTLIHNIGSYIYKVHIDRNYYVNFADAGSSNAQDAGKIYQFGKLFNDERLLQFSSYLKQLNNANGGLDLGTIPGFIRSLELKDAYKGIKPVAPKLKQAWLPGLQVLTAREIEGGTKGLFFAAKGGHNGESHNHNDIGNFVLYKDDTPIIVDAGVGVYTKQTFGADRYKLWYTQSAWHNCPTINGVMQHVGANYKASDVTYSPGKETTKLSMNLAAAYPQEADVTSWTRTFLFNHTKGILSLSENYKLKSFKEAATLSFLVNGTVTELKKGVLKLTNSDGKSVSIWYNPEELDYEIEVKKIDDARLATSWHNDLSRLMLKRKGKQLNGNFEIIFKD